MSVEREIRSIRLERLLSQNDFAKELGVAFSTVNRWETGKSKPNLKALKAIELFCKKHNMKYDIKGLKEYKFNESREK